MINLINTCVILDTKTNKYISEGYKPTKKNKIPMQKEIDRLNKKESGRYEMSFAFMQKGYELQTFNKNSY